DVLVIDEVLAVGDERFQRKCLDRIRQFQIEGRTIIFVTHSPDQVRSICTKAVVLNDGQVIAYGAPGEAIRTFRENLLEAGDALAATLAPAPEEPQVVAVGESGSSHPVRVTGVSFAHPGSADRPYVVTGEPLVVSVHFTADTPTTTLSFVVELRDDLGRTLVRSVSGDLGEPLAVAAGAGTVSFRYPSVPFADGAYDVSVGIEHRAGGEWDDWKESVAKIEVMNPTKSQGLVDLPATVTLEQEGAWLGPAVAR
ncbi:MAG TPA: Wzt carbohydrate-binding domain-containing protein, partial [Acidimicrobiia bacterium]|nr:Wzt carbohydrate-binding domain-containing protein [Acidimicrobiia bacterium]